MLDFGPLIVPDVLECSTVGQRGEGIRMLRYLAPTTVQGSKCGDTGELVTFSVISESGYTATALATPRYQIAFSLSRTW